MSLKKYSSAYSGDCGCAPLQAPPTPCCEAHEILERPSNCFKTTSNVVANSTQFFLTFENTCGNEVPINSAEVFFYHAAAGLIRIIGLTSTGESYIVQLIDPSKEGKVIEKGDCVLLTVIPQTAVSSAIGGRCVAGPFSVPSINSTGVLYILNGSGIPIGANLSFSWDGELGTYSVVNFISASGNIYAYTVRNDGSGHAPAGTIIEPGEAAACLLPIEVITSVDICDLNTSNFVDSLTGCLAGSPKGFLPYGEGYVPLGKADGTWDQTKLSQVQCCIITDGPMKFSGNGCIQGQDTVSLRSTGLDCFEEAYQIASANGTFLVLFTGDYSFVVDSFDSSDNTIVVKIAELGYLPEDETFLEFNAGTTLCLGECCQQCTNGPQITDINTTGDGDTEKASAYVFEVSAAYVANAPKHYLIGLNTSGAVVITELTSTYNDTLENGIGKPAVTDPLVMRQKICNTSIRKCVQQLEIEYNYEFAVSNIPADMRVHFEIGDYIANSATLSDGTTVNSLVGGDVASQADVSGYIDGPETADLSVISGTAIGLGGLATTKVWPKMAGFFKDSVFLRQCDCANIRTWLYVMFEPKDAGLTPGTASIYCVVRRRILKHDVMVLPMPANDPGLEGFAS